MRNYVGVVAASLLALNFLGCKQQSVAMAPMDTPSPVRVPVGPIPGPGSKYEKLPTNPYEGDQVAMVEGRRLFIWFNCYGCHGGHGGGGMGPSLRDPDWLYGNAPAEIYSSIAEGRGKGMPAWGTKIPEDQIWKLVTYIQTLNTSQEVDPPLVPSQPELKPSPQLSKEVANATH